MKKKATLIILTTALCIPQMLGAQSSLSHFNFKNGNKTLEMNPGGSADLEVDIKIPANNHIYVSHVNATSFSILTDFSVDESTGFALESVSMPQTEVKDDDRILKGKGTGTVAGTYKFKLFETKGRKASNRTIPVAVNIRTQMCNTKTNKCYRPANYKKTLRVKISGQKTVMNSRNMSSGVSWKNSYSAAISEAKRSKKNIFVVITAPTWCGACVYLERNVFEKSSVQEVLNENWIPLQVLDTNSDRNRFRFSGYPTMIILDPQGKELTRVNSRQADSFLNEIKPYEVTGSDETESSTAEIKGEAPVRFVQKAGSKQWSLQIGSSGEELLQYSESKRDDNYVVLSRKKDGKDEFVAVGLKNGVVLKWNGSQWTKWFEIQ